jgi:hypothetical protein
LRSVSFIAHQRLQAVHFEDMPVAVTIKAIPPTIANGTK